MEVRSDCENSGQVNLDLEIGQVNTLISDNPDGLQLCPNNGVQQVQQQANSYLPDLLPLQAHHHASGKNIHLVVLSHVCTLECLKYLEK